MKKFLAIYMAPMEKMQEAMKAMTPEMQKEQNELWNKWMESKKGSVADMGAPVGKNKRVTSAGVSDVRNEIGGYSIVEAESHDEAAKLFSDNPMLQGMPEAYVEVLEIMPMPGA